MTRSASAILDAGEWLDRRFRPLTAAGRQELAAEHEAAHATVAMVLGAHVQRVWVDVDSSGGVHHDHSEDRRVRAAVVTAARVWLRGLQGLEWPGGDEVGCVEDMRQFAVLTNGDRISQGEAQRLAGRILRERYDQVLALAERLVKVRSMSGAEVCAIVRTDCTCWRTPAKPTGRADACTATR